MFILNFKNVTAISHYIYYLATDNVHIVLENDNTRIKRTKKVVNVKFLKHASYKTSYDRLKSREIHFSNTGKITGGAQLILKYP